MIKVIGAGVSRLSSSTEMELKKTEKLWDPKKDSETVNFPVRAVFNSTAVAPLGSILDSVAVE